MKKKQYILLIVGILLICAVTLGFSYAYWMNIKIQDNPNVVESKCFSIEFSEKEGSDINLTNAYPISDEEGMKSVPYEFTITNTCDMYATYNINMEVLNTTTLSHDLIKAVVDDNLPKVATEYPSASATIDGATAYTLLSGGLIKDESRTYSFRMWVDSNATLENSQNKTVVTKIVVTASAEDENFIASNYIINLLDYNFLTMNNDDPDGNVRYMGLSPANYVWFNDELWRIIGVFNVKSSEGSKPEKRVKIIRNELIGYYSWDSSESNVNGGFGVNEWSQSDLMYLLNNSYYWEKTNGLCYNNSNNSTIDCDFTKIGLSTQSKILISEAVWNIGTIDGVVNKYSNTNVIDFYAGERSSNSGKICNSGIYCSDSILRTTLWVGQVGLMYPSDYGYATSGGTTNDRQMCLNTALYSWNKSIDCYQNNWLYNSSYYQWTMTSVPDSSNTRNIFAVYASGHVPNSISSTATGVRPVVYLKSNVKITGGDGTSINPYQLSL